MKIILTLLILSLSFLSYGTNFNDLRRLGKSKISLLNYLRHNPRKNETNSDYYNRIKNQLINQSIKINKRIKISKIIKKRTKLGLVLKFYKLNLQYTCNINSEIIDKVIYAVAFDKEQVREMFVDNLYVIKSIDKITNPMILK